MEIEMKTSVKSVYTRRQNTPVKKNNNTKTEQVKIRINRLTARHALHMPPLMVFRT